MVGLKSPFQEGAEPLSFSLLLGGQTTPANLVNVLENHIRNKAASIKSLVSPQHLHSVAGGGEDMATLKTSVPSEGNGNMKNYGMDFHLD